MFVQLFDKFGFKLFSQFRFMSLPIITNLHSFYNSTDFPLLSTIHLIYNTVIKLQFYHFMPLKQLMMSMYNTMSMHNMFAVFDITKVFGCLSIPLLF